MEQNNFLIKDLLQPIISEIDLGLAVVDAQTGVPEIFNRFFSQILGVKDPLLKGKSIREMIPGLTLGESGPREFFLPDLQKIVRVKTIPIGNNTFFVIMSEVMNRDETKTVLLNEAFKIVLDHIDEGIIVVDAEGKIIYCNEVQLKFDGQKFEDVVGRYSWDVYNFEKKDSTLFKCLQKEEPSKAYVHYYLSRAGQYVRVTGNNFPVKQGSKTLGAVAIDRNLQNSEEMVAKVVELQKTLQEGKRDLAGTLGSGYLPEKRFFSFEDILGESDAIRQSLLWAKSAARSDSPVFLYGETGTGKEMFAQSIHSNSSRNLKPLISINCAAIPENLLEGIIFGTVKGVFTGATDRKGLFEEADGGTLFLDEINSMPLNLQGKLLRALEERKVRRLGGKHEIPVDVRIISSCNSEPTKAVAEKQLRSDLYYRLAVVNIEIPPLRIRKRDIRILVDYFIQCFNIKLKKNIYEISPEIYGHLEEYDWPGNVRQLKHWVECAMNMVPEDQTILIEEYVPQKFNYFFIRESNLGLNIVNHPSVERGVEVSKQIREQEIVKVVDELKRHGGNITKAAKAFGISRQGLQYRMRKLGIK
ncbi:sigma-54 interaction domain-containing protein [Candidatus Formimonas warabiya]|nr:sigma 54-interacting transcriptional regulator [Candidatus Formimonas warabiya]